MQLAVVGRFYERIGDHAVNIGERVQLHGRPASCPTRCSKSKERFDTGGDPAEA